MSTVRPVVTPPAPWVFPIAEDSRFGNGVRVLLHHLPGQYVLSMRVVVPVRLAAEPEGREGVGTMTARLLDEGTSEHSPEAFAELMERHGMVLGAGMSDGGLSLDVDVPARHLGVAAALVTAALADPAFPEAEVRRIRRSRLAEIEQERASAGHRGSQEFARTLWAPGQRAATPTAGTAQSVARLGRDDLVAFHARSLGPDRATVVLAGDLTGLDVLGVLDRSLGSWAAPAHRLAGPAEAPLPAADAARVVIVDRPGSVQTEIIVGAPGPDRSTPHGWAPHPVVSFVLGGSPGARLDAVLREEKGYTYGMRCAFRPRVAGGSFVASGSVRSEVTVDAVTILLSILDDTARDGFTEKELRAGVDFVSRTAPGRYATADAVADETAALALEGLPLEFTTTTLRGVADLTREDLDDAYRRVAGQGWTIVLVGDAARIAGPLEAELRRAVSVVPV
jgi:zinc protease